MSSMQPLHALSDGSKLRVISSRDLIAIPVWNGNRVMDMAHVEEIKAAVGDQVRLLDFGYRVVVYTTKDATGAFVKESYIVDGQHRAKVVRDYYQNNFCEPNFPVIITEKEVTTEFDVIAYFNAINNSKPIKYTDKNMIINRYIEELEKAFNKSRKSIMIRLTGMRRPYLSVGKLREVLVANSSKLKDSASDIMAFVDRVKKWNEDHVKSADIDMLSNTKDADMIEKGSKLGFMLGVSAKMAWVAECL